MSPVPYIPKWIQRLLERILPKSMAEFVIGDLEEYYSMHCEQKGLNIARVIMLWNVLGVFVRFAFKKSRSNSNTMAMYRNYVKVAWRNLLKDKLYGFTKIGGLAIGVASCLLISLFVWEESSHDQDYPDSERIYRVVNVMDGPDGGKWLAHQPRVAGMLKDLYPEVEMAGRLIPYNWYTASENQVRPINKKQSAYEEGFAYADQELLEMLQVQMVYGQLQTALSEPNSVVISRRKAEKYFPGENPVGQTLIFDEDTEEPWVIGAVMENLPSTSHLNKFDFLLTLTGEEFWNGEQLSWCCSNYNTYIKLKEGSDSDVLVKKMTDIITGYYVPYLKEEGNQYADNVAQYRKFELQPVGEINLHSSDLNDVLPHSDIKTVILFGSVAIFILLLASINFVNLSTAKSTNRAKEVGLRKVVGSFRTDLIKQFLTESTLITSIAVLIGIFLAWILLPQFNELADKQLVMPWSSIKFLIGISILTASLSILSGIYPAFYLSSFRPISVMKGHLSRGAKSSLLRSVMVTAQFAISILMLVGAAVVYQQMQFILSKDLGFDKDQVIIIQSANTLEDKNASFRQELSNIAGVQNVAISSYLPVRGTKRDQNSFWMAGRKEIDKSVGSQVWYVDDNYLNTLGMKLVEGRNFSEDLVSDSSAVVINQEMAKRLGIKEPVGAQIESYQKWNIVGVVEDFHFENMIHEIGPVVMVRGAFGSNIPVKIEGQNLQQTIHEISSVWSSFKPDQPLRYIFMDQVYASMYRDVSITGDVFTIFSVLAVIVACLGLFALSAFMTEQRSKEISIRKVLGASVLNVFQLLTSGYLKLILLAMVLAIPLGWYFMDQWLIDFEYRVNIGWSVFVLSSLIVLAIALLTVSYETLKAAFVNPIKGLRSE